MTAKGLNVSFIQLAANPEVEAIMEFTDLTFALLLKVKKGL